jgi:hypothetical protein
LPPNRHQRVIRDTAAARERNGTPKQFLDDHNTSQYGGPTADLDNQPDDDYYAIWGEQVAQRRSGKGYRSNESGSISHELIDSNRRSVILTEVTSCDMIPSVLVVAANMLEDTAKKELAGFSENLVRIYQTTRRHIPEGSKG